MRQEAFQRQHEGDWKALQTTVRAITGNDNRLRKTDEDVSALPGLYRHVCHHLSLARARAYSPRLVDELSRLVMRGHQIMYRKRPSVVDAILDFIGRYPLLFRQQWHYMLVSGILFFGTFVTMLLVVQWFPHMAYIVVEPIQVAQMEAMYSPEASERLGPSRDSESDALMFGFYIRNNTGIGFRTFAGGLLFGLGSIFFLIYNGLHIGTIAGHLTAVGYIETFWGFVAGHSAPELTAIMLSGGAGLMLGWALIAPGRKSRLRALQDAGRVAVRIVYGAALLFFLAAFIEAFWSSIQWIEPVIKYMTGILFWILLWWYLLRGGRAHAV